MAKLHGDIDAAFGRVHAPLPTGLTHRLVRLEPVDAILHADHPLANAPAIRPAQLRDGVLRTPAHSTGWTSCTASPWPSASTSTPKARTWDWSTSWTIWQPTRAAPACCPRTCPSRRTRRSARSR
ncbi:hypothetical protein [Planomonospora sp. ID91781]|uniref:hypothetical protein n=1 Tax=Planomonospora sp. ID91781 TaxID=2738135 RepID=UPI0018C3EDC5|nr:hypothetical protein [Planomonospora sp. ID91781]